MLYSTTGAQSWLCWNNNSSEVVTTEFMWMKVIFFHIHGCYVYVYIAPILPLYIFTCPSNNLRWLWGKLAYLCTELCCRISIAFLIYFSKLFCMVSVLIFLSTWFSANLWGCIVHYMKLVLLLLKQTQAEFLFVELFYVNWWCQTSEEKSLAAIWSWLCRAISSLFSVVLIFLYSLLPLMNCFCFETWLINSFTSML